MLLPAFSLIFDFKKDCLNCILIKFFEKEGLPEVLHQVHLISATSELPQLLFFPHITLSCSPCFFLVVLEESCLAFNCFHLISFNFMEKYM